jgi:hypothetical protein
VVCLLDHGGDWAELDAAIANDRDIADDPFGYLGDTAQAVIERYARIGWRATGVAPEVHWSDLLGWCALASNYAAEQTGAKPSWVRQRRAEIEQATP